MASSSFWRELGAQFRAAPNQLRSLSVYWESSPSAVELPPQNPSSIDLATGRWTVIDDGLFTEYARRAASATGHPLNNSSIDRWLDDLVEYSPAVVRLDEIRGCDSTVEPPLFTYGFFIDEVCEVSARRCATLETEAIAKEFAVQAIDESGPPDTFKEKITRLRGLRGWSIEDLANEVGLHKTTVMDHLRGSRPKPANMKAYADKLGTTIDELNSCF